MSETRRALRSRPVAWNLSRRRRNSVSRPTNGGSSASERPAPRTLPTTRRARKAGTGALLPLSTASPAGLVGDRLGGRASRVLADQDGLRRGHRLEARRGVHEVAGDEALVGRADGHGGLAGQHPGPEAQVGADVGAERPDRPDEIEGGADGPLGVVLVGHGRAPDGHHGVADELLDRATVAADDLAGRVEVARQDLAHGLGVAALGQPGEVDEVGEQDGDDTPLGRRGRCERGHSGDGRRPTGGRGVSRAPQSAQNFAAGSRGAPQLGQAAESGVPHSAQNLAPGRFGDPQDAQLNRAACPLLPRAAVRRGA